MLLLLFSRFFSARGENRARNRVAKNPRATRCPNRTENASLRSFRPFSAKKTGRELGRFRCFHHRRRRAHVFRAAKICEEKTTTKSARGKNERKALTRRQFPRPPRPRSRRLVPRLSWSVVERTFWLFSIRKGVKDLSRFRAREKWRLFFVLKVPCFFKGRKENLA